MKRSYSKLLGMATIFGSMLDGNFNSRKKPDLKREDSYDLKAYRDKQYAELIKKRKHQRLNPHLYKNGKITTTNS